MRVIFSMEGVFAGWLVLGETAVGARAIRMRADARRVDRVSGDARSRRGVNVIACLTKHEGLASRPSGRLAKRRAGSAKELGVSAVGGNTHQQPSSCRKKKRLRDPPF